MRKLTWIVLIGTALLLAVGIVIAAENATHETAEKETKKLEQAEKNISVTQKATEEVKETATKAKEETTEVAGKAKEETKEAATKVEEAAGKKQPGFEVLFATIGLIAANFLGRRRN